MGPRGDRAVLVLGSGAYRIGSSVEFESATRCWYGRHRPRTEAVSAQGGRGVAQAPGRHHPVHRKRQGDRVRRRGPGWRVGRQCHFRARGERGRPLRRRHPGAAAAAHLPGDPTASSPHRPQGVGRPAEHRAIQHSVHRPGQLRQGDRVQPAGLAHFPLCLQGVWGQLHRSGDTLVGDLAIKSWAEYRSRPQSLAAYPSSARADPGSPQVSASPDAA